MKAHASCVYVTPDEKISCLHGEKLEAGTKRHSNARYATFSASAGRLPAAAGKLAINPIPRFNANVCAEIHIPPCVREFLRNVNYHKISLRNAAWDDGENVLGTDENLSFIRLG